jgi:asparagine synthase (glutamine-hydrolysing)
MGFTLPWKDWLNGPLKGFAEERIRSLQDRKLFRPEGVRWVWDAFQKGDPRVSWSRVWYLVVLEDWLQRNDVRN